MRWQPVLTICAAICLAACGDGIDRSVAGEPAPSLGAEAPTPLRILVIGGTSGIGLETVKLALRRGHTVTAMARRPELMPLVHPRLETIRGNIADSAAVRAAVENKDVVVTTISVGPTRKPVTVFSQGMGNVLAAMRMTGTSRLVAITGIGAGNSRGHGGFFYDRVTQPLLLHTSYEDKDREEALIRASDTEWTIVRPGFLNNGKSEADYRVIQNLEGITAGDIARADVAHFILSVLESDSYRRATVLLSN